MALLGLDTLILLIGLLPYVKLSKYFEATHKWLKELGIAVPINLGTLDEVAKRETAASIMSHSKPVQNNKKKKRPSSKETPASTQDSAVPKEIVLRFRKQKVELYKQENYPELEQLIWTSGIAVATFFLSECLYCVTNNSVFPGRQSGTSLFLAGISLQCLVLLLSLTLQMWQRMGNQENRLALVFGILGFWSAIGLMGVVSDTNALPDLSLFPDADQNLPRNQTWWLSTLSIASVCGLYTSLILLPALRFARIYHENTAMAEEKVSICATSRGVKMLFHLTMFIPLLVCLLYVEPLTGKPIVDTFFQGNRDQWSQMRTVLVALLSLIRVGMLKPVVQGFLDSTSLVVLYMARTPTTSSSETLRQYLEGQYWLTSYVAAQYLAPALLAFALAAVRGRFSGQGFGACSMSWSAVSHFTNLTRPAERSNEESPLIKLVKTALPPDLQITPEVYSIPATIAGPLVDFALLWSNMAWFVATFLGLLYFRQSNTARLFAVNVSKKME